MEEKILKSSIYVSIASVIINNFNILKANIDKINSAKSRLKYRKDLCQESKEGIKELRKEVIKNTIYLNALVAWLEILPGANLGSIFYIFAKRGNIASNIEEFANFVYSEINKIEDSEREKNANAYRYITQKYDLDPLVKTCSEDLRLSYEELKSLLDQHELHIDVMKEDIEEGKTLGLRMNNLEEKN